MAIDYSILPLGKDSREDGVRKRREQKASVRSYEQMEKAKVVKRDGAYHCRLVPGCRERSLYETAHLDNKGMGGDRGLRSNADQMVRTCFFHHQGKWSLHSNDLRVEYLTPEKANGPIEVWGKDEDGREFLVGREVAVGQWERD